MTEHKCFVFTFSDVEVREREFCIVKAGELLPVEPKAFRVLLFLLRSPHRLIKKDELLDAVWSDCAVSDNSLTRSIALLRRLLADDTREPRYIATVPTVGYRFLCDVKVVEDGFSGPNAASLPQPQDSNEFAPLPGTPGVEATPPRTRETARRWKVIVPVAAVVMAFLVAGYFYFHRAAKLTDKDTIVLADFINTTGDPVFDGTLRQGLAVQLEQSPFLSITSDQRNEQTLKMMGQPADAKLTPAIARELCQRTGSAAALNGSVAQIGTGYLLTLRAVNCSSGESLASTEAQASDKNHVLDALGKTASEMRNKLGESLSTVRKFDTPLEQATTPSLEALKAYSLGRKASAGSEYAAAVPFLQRAIRLDPNFAIAYARLGNSYRMLGEPNLAAENTRKAYELRERVSELENFYIESHYYQTTGELEKARQVYELWAQSYRRDWGRAAAETAISALSGQYEEGLAESREEVRLNSNGDGYFDLLYFYLCLNRLEEAQSTVEEAQAKKFDSPFLRALLYKLRFLQNDAAGMSQQVAWAAGRPGAEDALLGLETETAAYSGRLGGPGIFPVRQWFRPSGRKSQSWQRDTKATPPSGKLCLEIQPKPVSESRMRSTFRTAQMCSFWRLWHCLSQAMRYERRRLPML